MFTIEDNSPTLHPGGSPRYRSPIEFQFLFSFIWNGTFIFAISPRLHACDLKSSVGHQNSSPCYSAVDHFSTIFSDMRIYKSHRWTSSSSQQRSLSERIVICLIGVPLTESAQFSQPFVVSATMQLKKEDVHKLETFRSCQIRIFIHARISYSHGLHCASVCFFVPSATLKATKKSTSKPQAPRIHFMTFIQRRNRIGSPLQSEICSRISVAFI